MIIKSMSRKAPTFRQLASYIGQDSVSDDAGFISRNLYYDGGDQAQVSRLFYENYDYLPARKNGNALYHEVLVLPPQPHFSKSDQARILQSLAYKYCELRAPFQLAWGRVHFDTDYPHIHLMISSNEVHSDRRKRLDKKSFARIQRQMEQYRELKFPELTDSAVYDRGTPSQTVKIKSGEGEMVRRTHVPSSKQDVARMIREAMSRAETLGHLNAVLDAQGFRLYQRGQSWGVENIRNQRRYRLKTLGLASEFAQLRSEEKLLKPQLRASPKPPADDRATQLLDQRAEMERAAEFQLNRFDPELDEGPER